MKSVHTLLFGIILVVGAITAHAHDHSASATYLANEAVMITYGDTKIMFDPLFGEGFDIYPVVPPSMKVKIMKGEAPFDGVDAIFASHVHGDHFAAEEMIRYLTTHKEVRLFAPKQAVKRMRELNPKDMSIFDRCISFDIAQGGAPVSKIIDQLAVDAVRIPHSGNRWHIENIVFRVTLDEGVTVMHMGDADVNDAHFKPFKEHWLARRTDHAFPPYWFFGNAAGREILNSRINAKTATGVHVPIKVPLSLRLGKADFFSKPGESRIISLPNKDVRDE